MRSLTDNPFKMKKLRHDVKIILINGNEIYGKIFVGYNERILDVVNDPRHFIPIEDDSGSILIISKTSIISIDAYQVTGFAKENPTFFLKDEKKNLTEVINPAHNVSGDIIDSPAFNKPFSSESPAYSLQGICPYKVMDLPVNASIDDVKLQYTKIKEMINIPLFEKAGADKMVIALANLYLKQIDNAYNMIMKK